MTLDYADDMTDIINFNFGQLTKLRELELTNMRKLHGVIPLVPIEVRNIKCLSINYDSMIKAVKENDNQIKKNYKVAQIFAGERKITWIHFTGQRHTMNFFDFLLGVNGRIPPNFLKFDRLKLQSPEEFEKLNEHVNYGLTVCAGETKIKIRTFIPKEDIKIITVC